MLPRLPSAIMSAMSRAILPQLPVMMAMAGGHLPRGPIAMAKPGCFRRRQIKERGQTFGNLQSTLAKGPPVSQPGPPKTAGPVLPSARRAQAITRTGERNLRNIRYFETKRAAAVHGCKRLLRPNDAVRRWRSRQAP